MATTQQEYKAWQALCLRIRAHATPHANQRLPKPANLNDFEGFCRYYFPHYAQSAFGWFHKQAAQTVQQNPNLFLVLEWPREHAKSVFANVLVPLWLLARGELQGMMLASANREKAVGLLGDVQAELAGNSLFKKDFGEQATHGDWRDGHFVTRQGVGFWAFGRGQSPRGTRHAANRPNYGVVDDIDDKVLVRNPARVSDTVRWVLEDFLGALSVGAGRLLVAGNRIHKNATLAHLCGDIEATQPLKPGVQRIKVWAFEDTNHQKADAQTGKPAWHQRYTTDMLQHRIKLMGTAAARREFFHEHIEEGTLFKPDWVAYENPPPTHKLTDIVVYCDPSYQSGPRNDYKALVVVARTEGRFFVLNAWVRQAGVQALVDVFYQMYATYGSRARYFMEGNFGQDLLLDAFDRTGREKGHYIPIRADKRSKGPKAVRIENMAPLFERGLVVFNLQKKHHPDMERLRTQLIGFGSDAHDDAPDALEGALFILNKAQTNHATKGGIIGNFVVNAAR